MLFFEDVHQRHTHLGALERTVIVILHKLTKKHSQFLFNTPVLKIRVSAAQHWPQMKSGCEAEGQHLVGSPVCSPGPHGDCIFQISIVAIVLLHFIFAVRVWVAWGEMAARITREHCGLREIGISDLWYLLVSPDLPLHGLSLRWLETLTPFSWLYLSLRFSECAAPNLFHPIMCF